MSVFVYRNIPLAIAVLLLARYTLPAQIPEYDPHMHEAHRRALMQRAAGAAVVMLGADRHAGSDHGRFRQHSNFYYLTGYEEPGAAALLLPDQESGYILFVEPGVPSEVLWNGKRYGVDEAVSVYGADKAYPMEQFALILSAYLSDVDRVYCDLGDEALMQILVPALRSMAPDAAVLDVDPLLRQSRVIKNGAELQRMKKAIETTCAAHRKVLQQVRPGMYEYEVEGLIEHVYRQHGSIVPAFTPIIASGPNACILHYTHNDRMIGQGELLLMDIGADYGYYAADVTRTIPTSGKYTREQKEIYAIVLQAQEKAIGSIGPGVAIDVPGRVIIETLGEGLHDLGLVSDPQKQWQVKVWQMHGTSHWLGLDVHDAGPHNFREPNGAVFQPGMVLTVEPGVYINPYVVDHLEDFFPHIAQEERTAFLRHVRPALSGYRNIGIRIEDDILVTDTGHEVLSISAPKDMDAIEKLMSAGASEGR